MTASMPQRRPRATGNSPSPLTILGFILIVAIALLRCVIVFAPQTVFDVDPAVSPVPWGGLGMAGSLALDVMVLLGCAVAMCGEWRAGRGINISMTTLAILPLPIILWHGSREAGHLWLGSSWLAAIFGAVTLAHMTRDVTLRFMLMALLLAIASPLLLRGLSQITWEHAGTVAVYQQGKEAALQAKGWEADSPEVRIFERRLMQAQPLGWFATTNVLATMLAGIFVGSAALGYSAWRAKLPSGWTGVVGLLALSCGALLAFTGSKGAVLAIGAGGLMVFMLNLPRLHRALALRPGFIALILMAITILAVIVRGALLPESFLGDKSLLFRWHYWIASLGVVTHNLWTGVGPEGFQAAYTLFRVPRNPEEVSSAHNVFIDWIATLGLSGVAWVLLVVVLLARSRLPFRETQPDGPPRKGNTPFVPIIAISALGMMGSLYVEWPVIDSDLGFDAQSAMVRVIGFGLMPVIAIVLFRIIRGLGDRELGVAVLAITTTVLVHSQIEMSLTQPGPAMWAFAWLGLAGTTGRELKRSHRFAAMQMAIVCSVVAGWVLMCGVIPARAQEAMMEQAAVPIRILAQNGDDERLVLESRRRAAETLVEAYERWPINVRPMEAAVVQLELASMAVGASAPLGLVMQSADLIDRAVRDHRRPSSISLGVIVHSRLALITGDAEHWNRAIRLATRLTELDPNGLSAWRRLGDVRWHAGEKSAAADAYRRALECDGHFALDQLKRLSEKDRIEIKRRIGVD